MRKGNNAISSIFKGDIVIDKIMKGSVTVYEAFKKLLASGIPPLTLTKSKGVDLVNYKIYGKSLQESGNLFDNETLGTRITAYINVANGIWRQASDSWSVRLPCDKNTTYEFSNNNPNNIIFRCGYVTTEDLPSNVDGTPIDIPIYSVKETTNNSPITITTGEDAKYLVCQFSASYGEETVKSLKVIQTTPTPDNPIEIESVGDKTSNLLVYPYYYNSRTINGLTFTVNADGIVTLNGTATADTTFLLTASSTFKLKPNRYVVSGSPEGSSNSGYYMVWQNKTFIYNSPATVTLTQEEGANIYIAARKGTVCDNVIFKPMLQLSTGIVNPYEPYGYKIPVKVTGKNLYSAKNGVAHSRIVSLDAIKVKPNTNYVLSVDSYTNEEPLFAVKGLTEYVENMTPEESWNVGTQIKGNVRAFNSGEYKYIIIRMWNTNEFYGIDENTKIQLEEGTVVTEYEPYYESTTTNIYLKEPLRKIGDYADYIDFENQKVIRNIKELVFDGTNKGINTISQSSGLYYGVVNTDDNQSIGESKHTLIQSNHFNTSYGVSLGATYLANAIRLVMVNTDQTLNTKALWNEWLQSKYNEGNPVVVDYVLLNLDDTEDITLPNIPTIKGTSIIEVDTGIQPSNMAVTYLGKE